MLKCDESLNKGKGMKVSKQKKTMTKYYWTAFCKQNRHAAIDKIVQIINTYGAVIGSKMFSDLSLSLIIEYYFYDLFMQQFF